VTDHFDDFTPVAEPPPPAAPVRQHLATVMPVVLHQVEPVYPRLARIAGKEGLVILEAVIRKDGSVGEVTVLRAPEGKFGFDREAVSALRQWRFRPGEMHGRKVDVIMTLTIKFRLDR
jgi:protein TonB